jgi:hypothetical protein
VLTTHAHQIARIIRLWYQRLCNLNSLDGASATTIPDDPEERIIEKPGYRVPRKFRDWANARLRDFDRGLRTYALRQAARQSLGHAGMLHHAGHCHHRSNSHTGGHHFPYCTAQDPPGCSRLV